MGTNCELKANVNYSSKRKSLLMVHARKAAGKTALCRLLLLGLVICAHSVGPTWWKERTPTHICPLTFTYVTYICTPNKINRKKM